jgi:hypothetical protein
MNAEVQDEEQSTGNLSDITTPRRSGGTFAHMPFNNFTGQGPNETYTVTSHVRTCNVSHVGMAGFGTGPNYRP